MIWLPLQLLIAYALGCVSGSLILGRVKGVDVRTHGSGNAGAGNAFRVLGWRFALGVLCIDVLKGVMAAALVPCVGLAVPGAGLWCGLAAMVGHVWPAWHGFRGGKAAATGLGVCLVMLPLTVLPMLGVWLVMVSLTGYASMATLSASVVLIAATVWLSPEGLRGASVGFALASVALLWFTHRDNLRRLRRGEENRLTIRPARKPASSEIHKP